jgi:hypothetical protein
MPTDLPCLPKASDISFDVARYSQVWYQSTDISGMSGFSEMLAEMRRWFPDQTAISK